MCSAQPGLRLSSPSLSFAHVTTLPPCSWLQPPLAGPPPSLSLAASTHRSPSVSFLAGEIP